jgi:AcrR family transcriptional regulator
VAERIVVTKTALYRHFKSRADIEEAMSDRFDQELADTLEASEPNPRALRQNAVGFFRNHEGYLFYFIYSMFADARYPTALYNRLENLSPKVATFTHRFSSWDREKQIRMEAALLKGIVSVILASYSLEDPRLPEFRTIQDELLGLLDTGLPDFVLPPEARLRELEAIAAVRPEAPQGPENRLLTAVAQAVGEYGMRETTIERIAEKMGTAKSSLYFYSRNKEEMLRELMSYITKSIMDLCMDRARMGKNLSEQIYICMAAQAQYLLSLPEVTKVFNWARYEMLTKKTEDFHEDFDMEGVLRCFKMDRPETPSPMDSLRFLALLKWALILSASVVIHGQCEEENTEQTMAHLRAIYASMLHGDKELA